MILLGSTSFVVAFLISAIITRRTISSGKLHDHPNERSLHYTPVPRGGGVAILIAASICLLATAILGKVPEYLLVPWIGCGLIAGLLGWIDDHRNVSSSVRLILQLVIASVFSVSLVNSPGIELPWFVHSYRLLVVAAATVAIAWVINLYNFMDGADGYAAGDAVLVATAGALIAGAYSVPQTTLLALPVAGAAAGFLVWNWQPARIFMGDVGSYFLGFQFAALITFDLLRGNGPWMWLILLAPFVVDSTLTVSWRMWRQEQWWTAHRTHVYQLLILNGKSHAVVSVTLCLTTLCVLVPLASLVVAQPSSAPIVTASVYALTAIMWLVLRRKITRQNTPTT
jgi:Fuc2NAc and GlcNAc transferase